MLVYPESERFSTFKTALKTLGARRTDTGAVSKRHAKQEMTMSTRYPTTNPLDRIFLGIANLVIVFAGAVVLYHYVVTSLDPPPNEATAVAMFRPIESALPTIVAEASAPTAYARRVSDSIVR
jgi:hypothetical protein